MIPFPAMACLLVWTGLCQNCVPQITIGSQDRTDNTDDLTGGPGGGPGALPASGGLGGRDGGRSEDDAPPIVIRTWDADRPDGDQGERPTEDVGGVVPSDESGVLLLAEAEWTFDDCADTSQTLADTSGHAHTGTKTGSVKCATGENGKGLYFDGRYDADSGTSTWIEVSDDQRLRFQGALTLAAWVKPDDIAGSRTIVNKWYGFGDSYMLMVEDGRYLFRVVIPTGPELPPDLTVWWHDISAPARPGVWTHVAGVYDGTQSLIYLNGELAASIPLQGVLLRSERNVCIGGCPPWNAFQGTIDDVRIWAQALTADQVRTVVAWNQRAK